MHPQEQEQEQQYNMPQISTMAWVLIFVIVIGILYLTLVRYRIAGNAISAGDKSSAALMLSPELVTGISSILRQMSV